MKNQRQTNSMDQHSQSLPVKTVRQLWIVFREAVQRLISDEAFSLAGNIAFRTIFSVFPFLIFLTSLAGFLGTPEMADKVVSYMLDVVPNEIVDGISPEIHSLLTVARTDLMSLSILLIIWTASAGVDSLRVGLNRAYGLAEHRSMLLLYVQNILFVLVFAAMLMLLAFLIVLAPVGMDFIEHNLPGYSVVSSWFELVRYPVMTVLLFLVLYAAHLFLPARWHTVDLFPGIALTLVVWMVLAEVYSYFLTHFARFASTYAGLAGVIVALYFTYLSALVFIFGGEINRAIRLCREARLDPDRGEQKAEIERV